MKQNHDKTQLNVRKRQNIGVDMKRTRWAMYVLRVRIYAFL